MKRIGKMVYCTKTFQVFPSAKEAANSLNIKYHQLIDELRGKTKNAHHVVYVENTSDINAVLRMNYAKQQEIDKARKEVENLERKLQVAKQKLSNVTNGVNICANCEHDYNGHCMKNGTRHSYNESCDEWQKR